jgi:hypothetical protein
MTAVVKSRLITLFRDCFNYTAGRTTLRQVRFREVNRWRNWPAAQLTERLVRREPRHHGGKLGEIDRVNVLSKRGHR